MRIKEQDLKRMIRESVRKKLNSILGENADYTATKQVVIDAQEAAFRLEQDIVKSLNLISPDNMSDVIRARYSEIMDTMKEQIVGAVEEAITKLRPYPRINGGVQ